MTMEDQNSGGAGRMPVLVNLTTSERYTINEASIKLGRAPENHIILPEDGYASADHARVYFENGAWWVEDLQSSNGTSVNEQLISGPHQLAPGDTIKVGRTHFRIE